MYFKRGAAALAALALAVSGSLAVTGSAQASGAVPIVKPRPALEGLPPIPVEWENKMRESGEEARIIAEQEKAAKELEKDASRKTFKGKIPKDVTQGNKKLVEGVNKTAAYSASAMVSCPNTAPCYYYNAMQQKFDVDPATSTEATVMIGKPFVDTPTWTHSLGQVAVRSADTEDIVEFGWTVDKGQRADGNPILFASHSIDDVWKGYNTGFVDYVDDPATPAVEGAVNLGAGLPKPVQKRFFVGQTATAFWVGYDTGWVAYVPKSRWTPGGVQRPFYAATADLVYVQWFFEVAAGETEPCTDMGTGTLYNATGTPTPPVADMSYYSVGGTATPADWGQLGTNPTTTGVWGATETSPTSFVGGGPGWNSAGTAGGTTNAC